MPALVKPLAHTAYMTCWYIVVGVACRVSFAENCYGQKIENGWRVRGVSTYLTRSIDSNIGTSTCLSTRARVRRRADVTVIEPRRTRKAVSVRLTGALIFCEARWRPSSLRRGN
jgi:hypothetical protein